MPDTLHILGDQSVPGGVYALRLDVAHSLHIPIGQLHPCKTKIDGHFA